MDVNIMYQTKGAIIRETRSTFNNTNSGVIGAPVVVKRKEIDSQDENNELHLTVSGSESREMRSRATTGRLSKDKFLSHFIRVIVDVRIFHGLERHMIILTMLKRTCSSIKLRARIYYSIVVVTTRNFPCGLIQIMILFTRQIFYAKIRNLPSKRKFL